MLLLPAKMKFSPLTGHMGRPHYLLVTFELETVKEKGFVIVSNDLNHTKQSVYSYYNIKDNYGSIAFLVMVLVNNSIIFVYSWEKFIIKWHFFAISHGNGAVLASELKNYYRL